MPSTSSPVFSTVLYSIELSLATSELTVTCVEIYDTDVVLYTASLDKQ